jgi:hypothetical protein
MVINIILISIIGIINTKSVERELKLKESFKYKNQ